MARSKKKRPQLDDPARTKRGLFRVFSRRRPKDENNDGFGRMAEAIARFMGTPAFLVGMTIFCGVWLGWNTFMPESIQFDPRALNFTLLTLILSLQASYAAPLLLLSDNRQADRDRVQAEQDRQSNEKAHATTEFITREIASLRIAMADVATRDYVRGELRDLLEEIQAGDDDPASDTDIGDGTDPIEPSPDHSHLRSLIREDIRAVLREELAQMSAESGK
ncbi:DUF1003 domain-containing protein [Dermabacter sp. p3-SID358]|uniref:DUF1003 domain-containing protein n=1 Tax=Dermabacter sp. p3-SID358 TaxID=2916114 RepID=UPI0021A3F10C|nr:DUF1003 domain-containing protein [Dermabacter sp. p3-SID358]MCT1866647.1 DUF1003 domain-containing protein [Dermabacter sp. p3-SID358]